ncbi:hypothetical protein L1280_000627 [Deinococcus sp. HSC-46F16]|uniref:BsuPI-related putative proteinase inhibitor n=1 Tax=Deinococcus sp. HSC-46F16 TaxID=2910968 RepID=UPI00209F3F80|nr:hypothetical protein [Deinococcus sp. HSC-46F16]MCP2013499.1 hypothetical protein [Deinococcus sp. HSC-46F16]
MPSLRRALLTLLAVYTVATAQARPPLAPVMGEQEVGSLPLRLNLVALPSYTPGEVVRLKLFLKNVSHKPLALEVARNVPDYDITVQNAQGQAVWSCAGAEPVVRLSMNEVRTLAPGQTWSFACEWPQWGPDRTVVARGTYVVSASLWANGQSRRSTSRRITLR